MPFTVEYLFSRVLEYYTRVPTFSFVDRVIEEYDTSTVHVQVQTVELLQVRYSENCTVFEFSS
jgi:hypothetical protein